MNFNKNAAALLLVPALAVGALAQERRAVRVRWVMGTACEISARGAGAEAAVAAAFDEISLWDRVLSLYKEESELNSLNAAAGRGPFKASAELFAATEAALRMAAETGGAYDPTVLPVLRRGPSALPLMGWTKVRLDREARTIELPARGMGLDFGGIGKGWALDRAAERLRERGVTQALLNFGGQILVLGDERVEVPGLSAPLALRDASVSTSGGSERPGHIVSPFDGLPVRAGSASAVLASAAEADAWSTALYVLRSAPPKFRGRAIFVPSDANPRLKGDRT